MTQYVAWMRLPEKGKGKGCFASYHGRLIVADTPEEIRTAFGSIADPVELSTITAAEWLAQDSLALDVPPPPAIGPVPTVEELRRSSRWRLTDPTITPATGEPERP